MACSISHRTADVNGFQFEHFKGLCYGASVYLNIQELCDNFEVIIYKEYRFFTDSVGLKEERANEDVAQQGGIE